MKSSQTLSTLSVRGVGVSSQGENTLQAKYGMKKCRVLAVSIQLSTCYCSSVLKVQSLFRRAIGARHVIGPWFPDKPQRKDSYIFKWECAGSSKV